MVTIMATVNQTNQQTVNTSECLICGAELSFTSTLEVGELLECYDCGTELEVDSVMALVLIVAPAEGDVWGQ